MTRRKLSEDEVALWRKVTETAQRMHPERKSHEAPLPKPKPKPKRRQIMPMTEFEMGAKTTAQPAHDLSQPISERIARAPLNMDRKTHTRLKRGKMSPEGRLDLHGLTMAQAHPRLLASFCAHRPMANGWFW